MDIAAWLRGLGLEQYEPAFRENAIDAETLAALTAEDLRELGVTALGHRKKLLAAIAALGGTAGAPPPAAAGADAATALPPASADRPSGAAPGAGGERRQLTVLFCDLVGSTALSARLDPEDMGDIIRAFQTAITATAARFEGHVAKFMGDGALIYFGYPRAHEDDAERAVRAGLGMVEAVRGLRRERDLRLKVRIGIATGLVVVGELIGQGTAQEQAVVGDTPNLAARLQALAEPNAVVIAPATRRLLGGVFELAALGLQRLKGFAEPVPAWAVLGESQGVSRFEAARVEAVMPMVGREQEVALLLDRWRDATAGEGQAVLLSGEAGIGKSRILEALRERIRDEPHAAVRYQCSPHHANNPFYPVIAQLRHAAGIAADEPAEAKLAKLDAMAARSQLDAAATTPVLAALLSIPTGARHPPLELAPAQLRERIIATLIALLAGLARTTPVLFLLEDAHWIDPTTLELVNRMVDALHGPRLLMVATFRPEFAAPWLGRAQVTLLALNRLGRRQAVAMIERVTGGKPLPSEVFEQIIAKTDGVPLFIEELTKTVLESGLLREEASAYVLAGPLTRLAIPATLQDSLMARLDRLAPVKEVAQIGAAIGREFSYRLIAAVSPLAAAALEAALRQLVASELVYMRGTPPDAVYSFKHALVQDTAYATLLRGPRQALHGRIADALLAPAGEEPDAAPELIAYHLQNAGRSMEAILYWRKAAEQALRSAANREAIGHLRRALSLAAQLPEADARWRLELAILAPLGSALMSVHGWSAAEVEEAVERAAAVGRRLEASRDIAPAIANLWIFNVARGRLDRAGDISTDLFRIARALDDPEVMLQAHHCAWGTDFFQGRFAESGAHLEAGRTLYDETTHAHHRHIYLGHDPGVCRLNFASVLQGVLGYPDRGAGLEREGVALARRLRHVPSLANALWRAAETCIFRGDVAAASALLQELLSLAEVHGLPMQRAHGLIQLGWTLSSSGETAEGIAKIELGFRILAAMGSQLQVSQAYGLFAESLRMAERYAEGLAQADRALEIAAAQGTQWNVAHLRRLRAELLLHLRGSGDEAVEAELQRAIAVAKQQGARYWELGAATLLARLWGERGRRAEARTLLAPLYGWFTEGFAAPNLAAARALLAELA